MRSSDVTPAAARSAEASTAQAVSARARTTSSRPPSASRRAPGGACDETAATTTYAINQAWATRSRAVRTPSATVTRTKPLAAVERRASLGSSADIGPPRRPGCAADALAVLTHREAPQVGIRERLVDRPVQKRQLVRDG